MAVSLAVIVREDADSQHWSVGDFLPVSPTLGRYTSYFYIPQIPDFTSAIVAPYHWRFTSVAMFALSDSCQSTNRERTSAKSSCLFFPIME